MLSRAELVQRLVETFAWRGDRTDDSWYADVTGWWRDPELIQQLGVHLADLFRDRRPTVVLGVQSRGFHLGALVAVELGVGFVEVRKGPAQLADSDRWLTVATPPDYRDRNLVLGFPARLLQPTDRVLLVDDWIDTGGQALGVRRLVDLARAAWVGVAVIVDGLESSETRRTLNVSALVRERRLA
ncbi:phosphoribosyltransferase family protein [Actinokineospora sp. HUAS TT18]|uniref:phosphoribosyltransferase family protein n=1 Tax=Actinokineospora sp. HUAS TT18 TaxID=3447451 RepID=UPI003F520601